MFKLSTNTKEAIKIGLAITISYYVALRFSWMSPTWAAIAVAFISLPTAGQSFQKGLLRMGGTLLALVAAFFFLGLFPQDRWLFFISFTPYLAFVSYKMTGKDGQYFWFVAAFVSLMIITAGSSGSTEHVFEFGMYRTLETLIGIVIWTLVSVFIWPRSNRGALENISQVLLANQQSFLHDYLVCIMDSDTGEKLVSDRSQLGKLLSQLDQTIGAAASESYEVREVRNLWQRFHQLSYTMMGCMDRLQSGYSDLQEIDVEKVLPEIRQIFSEFTLRFEYATNLLEGKQPSNACNTIQIILSEGDERGLDHFQRAAVQLTKNDLVKIDTLTCAMVACISEIKGSEATELINSEPVMSDSTWSRTPLGLPVLDPDRVRASIMVVLSLWVAVLIWIYFDPPGHMIWYQFVPTIVLAVAQTPFFEMKLLKPFALAYLAGIAVYVFLMPQLSMFLELGLVIFVFTFLAACFFDGVNRIALYLGMFNMVSIENHQSYDFASLANTFVFTICAILVVFAFSYITRTPRQEKAFLCMLSRYFRSCAFLISRLGDTVPPKSIIERMKRAYYHQELSLLPTKLAAWGSQIDKSKFPNTSAQQIGDLVATLQTLTHRIQELEEARNTHQAARLTKALVDESREWILAIGSLLGKWSVQPEAESADALRVKLSARLTKLNIQFEETLNSFASGEISEEEGRNFYQLLGSYRGLAQAGIAYADAASNIDWLQWREEKF